MSNHTTGAQRYNKRMDEIFERSKSQGHNSLYPETKGQIAKNKKEYNSKSKALKKVKKDYVDPIEEHKHYAFEHNIR